jgi:hypothetical protein
MLRLFLAVLACLLIGATLEQGFPLNNRSGSGLVERYPLNTSGTYTEPAAPTFEIDFSQTVGATVTPNVGPVMTVTGTPVKVTDGTYPLGLSGTQGYAWAFDGSTSYLSCTYANCGSVFHPSNDFSAVFMVMPSVVSTTPILAFRASTSWFSNAEWIVMIDSNSKIEFFVSQSGDTTHYTELTSSNSVSISQMNVIMVNYHFVASGSSVMSVYVNGTLTSSSVAVGPIFASTSDMYFGMGAAFQGKYAGLASHIAYYTTALSQATYNTIRQQWLLQASSKNNVLSTTNTAPPSIMVAPPSSGTQPFLVAPLAGVSSIGSFVSGSGGLYTPSAKINHIPWYQSFEAGIWTGQTLGGWVTTLGSGSTVTPDMVNYAEGLRSAKITQTGSTAVVSSSCGTDTIGGTNYFYGRCFAKKLSGTASCQLQIKEYSDGTCSTTPITTENITPLSDVSTSWSSVGAPWLTALTVIAGDSIALGFSGYAYGNYDFGVASTTLSYLQNTEWPLLAALNPAIVYIHSGINDLILGTTLANMESAMSAIGTAADSAGIKLVIDNIGTYTGYTSGQMTQLASYNSWLATTFAAAHPTAVILDFLSWAENGSGNPQVCQYADFDAACEHPNATGYAAWAATVNTHLLASPGSWRFQINCTADTAVTDWDACELYAGNYNTDDVCVVNAFTTATCNASVVSGTYQLSTGSWHINRTVALSMDWSTTTSRYLFAIPATSGSNNKMQLYVNNNVLYWDVYTSAGVKKEATVACAETAHTNVMVSAYHSYAGNIWVCCNGTCGSRVSGATITTPSSTFYLGGDGTVGSDVWINGLNFYNK